MIGDEFCRIKRVADAEEEKWFGDRVQRQFNLTKQYQNLLSEMKNYNVEFLKEDIDKDSNISILIESGF